MKKLELQISDVGDRDINVPLGPGTQVTGGLDMPLWHIHVDQAGIQGGQEWR